MVIQRWQSVYLLLGVFAMILVSIRPFGMIMSPDGAIDTELVAIDFPVFLIVNILTGLLMLIDIFLFKNLKLQRMVAAICVLLIIASAVSAAIVLASYGDLWQVAWYGAPVGIICALICTILARHRMGEDEKKLRSYDRLR